MESKYVDIIERCEDMCLSRKVKYYKISTLVSDPNARLNITARFVFL